MGRQVMIHPPAAPPEPEYVPAEEEEYPGDVGELAEDPDNGEATVTLFADPHDADLCIDVQSYWFVDDPSNVIYVDPTGEEMSTPLERIGETVETSIKKAIAFSKAKKVTR